MTIPASLSDTPDAVGQWLVSLPQFGVARHLERLPLRSLPPALQIQDLPYAEARYLQAYHNVSHRAAESACLELPRRSNRVL